MKERILKRIAALGWFRRRIALPIVMASACTLLIWAVSCAFGGMSTSRVWQTFDVFLILFLIAGLSGGIDRIVNR